MFLKLKRIFFRQRPKISLVFSTVLLLLYFLLVMFPSKSLVQRTYESRSVLIESPRSEYYVLNRELFEVLARTSIECLIQVEPGKKWSSEATVKTTLLDSGYSSLQDGEYTDNNNKYRPNGNGNARSNNNNNGEWPRKYILAYRHFEQLGKTLENLIQLTAIAQRWGRNVVKPDVNNSRFTLQKSGGPSFPMDIYFDVSSLNQLLRKNGYARLVGLENFLEDCNYVNSQVKTTVVHFLYNDYYKGNTKKWYHRNEEQFQNIVKRTSSTGWTWCPFINKRLGLSKSLEGINIGRQVCVNPEVIMGENEFEERVLNGDKCVVFIEWRGFGKARTHFSPQYSPFMTPKEIKHHILPSDLITREVIAFKNSKLPSSYISVHLRSERQFTGHSLERLQLCINHVVYLVSILRELRGVTTVFLATDMTRFGSDSFDRPSFYTLNATGKYRIRREDLARIHADVTRRLNAVTYEPTTEPFSRDKGIVSLIEMNILKGGVDLVTVGSGTFHAWLVDVFRQHKKQYGRRGYTISKICPDGNT